MNSIKTTFGCREWLFDFSRQPRRQRRPWVADHVGGRDLAKGLFSRRSHSGHVQNVNSRLAFLVIGQLYLLVHSNVTLQHSRFEFHRVKYLWNNVWASSSRAFRAKCHIEKKERKKERKKQGRIIFIPLCTKHLDKKIIIKYDRGHQWSGSNLVN